MVIWISWNRDIRVSLNCRDRFPGRKIENLAPISCRPGPMLWPSIISFELHAKMAEEIDLEMCSYGQCNCRKFKCSVTLTLIRDRRQGDTNIHSTCRTTSMLMHVTVASRSSETWPFEFRKISIFGEVWTLVIAFVEGNTKLGLRQAVGHFPYYQCQSLVLSCMRNWRRK